MRSALIGSVCGFLLWTGLANGNAPGPKRAVLAKHSRLYKGSRTCDGFKDLGIQTPKTLAVYIIGMELEEGKISYSMKCGARRYVLVYVPGNRGYWFVNWLNVIPLANEPETEAPSPIKLPVTPPEPDEPTQQP